MYFGILIFAQAIILGIGFHSNLANIPSLSSKSCDKSYETTQCHCKLPNKGNDLMSCIFTLKCSSDDNAKAKRACEDQGFTDGYCTEHPDFAKLAWLCKSYVCNATKLQVLTDFENTAVKNPERVKCYCPDDYTDDESKSALIGVIKAVFQLQVAHGGLCKDA